jgi:cytochrome c biogenesis protein CcmG/thiol:disulfide interchange protein DsbE
MNSYITPLLGFLVLAVFFAIGLRHDPGELPSALIGKPAPAFDLPLLADTSRTVSSKSLHGQVWVLNVFASWCPPCREEHPHVVQLAKASRTILVGLNYKDARSNALQWLRDHGNPFTSVVADVEGRTGIDYGVYGVPETFVIDKSGLIRFKHTGPLTSAVVQDKILPLLAALDE